MASPEWTVERHLEAGSEQGRVLWHRFADLSPAAASTRSPSRRRRSRSRGRSAAFAGARPKGDELIGYFDVNYRVEDPRIRSASPYQKDLFVHHFRIS